MTSTRARAREDRDKPRQGVVANTLNLFRNGRWLLFWPSSSAFASGMLRSPIWMFSLASLDVLLGLATRCSTMVSRSRVAVLLPLWQPLLRIRLRNRHLSVFQGFVPPEVGRSPRRREPE